MGCGSNGGGCGCADKAQTGEAQTPSSEARTPTNLAHINGVFLHAPGERPDDDTLRQRACTELLRQRAQSAGLLAGDDAATGDGVNSAAATAAIEALLDRELQLPTPDEAACRRHFAANAARYAHGERVHARHILFVVTSGVNVTRLRERAEALMIEVRADPQLFAERAAALSNCPSGADGGELGWLTREDCAPEFARELIGMSDVGVLPRLVHSRFGLHVVEVLAREPGLVPTFEQVQGAVTLALQQQAFATALRQYLMQLVGQARVGGVELDAAQTPLTQ